jgi:phage baseplate assembly protein gpV
METINIILKKPKPIPGVTPAKSESPFDERSGFFGMVTAIDEETNTITVRSDSLREYTGIRVASLEWVTIDENNSLLTGERKLPPVNTFVYCLMPTGSPSSAIALCSVFAYNDSMGGGITAFKEKTKESVFIDKKIDNGGWKFTHDIRSGTRKIQNAPKDGEETIAVEIDQEKEGKEKVKVAIHGNIVTIDPEKGIRIESDKDFALAVKGKADNAADGDMSFKCTKNGLLEIGNSVATLGKMVGEFLDIVTNLDTVGSPANHSTGPVAKPKLTALKTKWDKVFK